MVALITSGHDPDCCMQRSFLVRADSGREIAVIGMYRNTILKQFWDSGPSIVTDKQSK